jgi:hypothetical protein
MHHVFLVIYFVLLFGYSLYRCEEEKSKDVNLEKTAQGKTSKIEYQCHSYVVWSINSGGGIVHDPDCKCHGVK